VDFLKHHTQIPLKWWVVLSAAVLIGILIFGLNPKGYEFSNDVNWVIGQPGIRFGKYGIAYTNSFFDPIGDNPSKPNGFSIELALKPEGYQEKGTNVILVLHNGNDRSQLLIWQYHSWIILMNGDDYDNKRRTRRIAVNIDSKTPTTRFLAVTTGEAGTDVYLDGRFVNRKKDLILKIPNGGKTRLLIGNSVYGKKSWQGDIYGLAFYGYSLTDQDIKRHFMRWFQDKNFSFAKIDKPVALYFFNEKKGITALDHAGGKHPIEIPSRMRIFKKKMLSSEWSGFKPSRSLNEDNILNLLGFVPFGFILAATLIKFGGNLEKYYFLITVLFCFTVSLIIEILQAWLPSRTSSMPDLIFNTLGALIGAIIFRSFIVSPHDRHPR
jgi:VanZ like family/Concanavalin A-like lectin/glucanases superfamily